jgi:DNA-binding transcriptional LysR family regulator
MADFELRQVRIFVTVAEELHFRRASERLYLPQSVVSEQVKRLEHVLGVELFDRTRRNVSLTPAGASLLPRARTILNDAAAFSAAASQYRPEPVLRLGTGCEMGRRLPLVLKELARQGYAARADELPPKQRATALVDGALDAAFFRGRIQEPMLRGEHVWDERLIAAMPENHPLASRKSASIEELAEWPVALAPYDANPALNDLMRKAYENHGLNLDVSMPFTTVEATFAVLAASPTPAWTPVYDTYEAEHQYEGIRVIGIEPAITIPTFLAAAPTIQDRWYNDLEDACQAIAPW